MVYPPGDLVNLQLQPNQVYLSPGVCAHGVPGGLPTLLEPGVLQAKAMKSLVLETGEIPALLHSRPLLARPLSSSAITTADSIPEHLSGSRYLESIVILTTQRSFENTLRTWEHRESDST